MTPERTCKSGKARFDTKDSAARHNRGQSPYPCSKCKGWHLSGALSRIIGASRMARAGIQVDRIPIERRFGKRKP